MDSNHASHMAWQILLFVRHLQPVVLNSMYSSRVSASILRYGMSCCMADNMCRACSPGELASYRLMCHVMRHVMDSVVVIHMSVVQSAVEISCMVQADPWPATAAIVASPAAIFRGPGSHLGWLPPEWQAIRNVHQHLLFGPCVVPLQGWPLHGSVHLVMYTDDARLLCTSNLSACTRMACSGSKAADQDCMSAMLSVLVNLCLASSSMCCLMATCHMSSPCPRITEACCRVPQLP